MSKPVVAYNPSPFAQVADMMLNIVEAVELTEIDRMHQVCKNWDQALKTESVHQRLRVIFGVNLYPDLRPYAQQLKATCPIFYSTALKDKLFTDMVNPAMKNRFPLPLPNIPLPIFVVRLPTVQINNYQNDQILP